MMGKSRGISQYRERLDKSLASADLQNRDALEALVRNQLRCSSVSESEGCSEDVVAKRSGEVSNFIGMLRSASVTNDEQSHAEWKLKDDNEEYRVMYRPGPEGSPFHSLLVEGCVDGPVDVCLCVSWEAPLYRKWWPQFTLPPFKISHGECLQRIRLGEQVCLVRVKVPWPMSSREAVVHYYMFEYLQDDLIILLFNTIPDIEHIDISTHGFSKDGIPEANEVVRIDVVGGIALQKVTAERSYFRTIASLDMKLDFVPAALINFISRQLIGSGFRLYQKTVSSLSSFDQDYSKVLEEPMYAQLRRAFFPAPEPNEEDVEGNSMNDQHQPDARKEAEERSILVIQPNSGFGNNGKVDAIEVSSENEKMQERKACGEIEEDDGAANVHLQQAIAKGKDHVAEVFPNNVPLTGVNTPGNITKQKNHANYRRKITIIRPEVKQALETLEKAISLVRCHELKLDEVEVPSAASTKEERKRGAKLPSLSEDRDVSVKAETDAGVVGEGKLSERTSLESRRSSSSCDIRCAGSSSSTRETNHKKVAPVYAEQHQPPLNGIDDAPAVQHVETASTTKNGARSDSSSGWKEFRGLRKCSFCCFATARHE